MLSQENELSIRTLAERLHVSPMTIYRDLQELEKRQSIIRTVGGAIIRPGSKKGYSWVDREESARPVKDVIGQEAASLIQDNEIVLLDAGTTVLAVARALREQSPLTIVTHSIPIIILQGNNPNRKLLIPGGQYQPETHSIVGPYVMDFLNDINADTLVMSASAVGVDLGLANVFMDSVAIQRTMIQRARRIILVADYSKFEKTAPMAIVPLSAVDVVVTDSRMPELLRQEIRDMGLDLIIVDYPPEVLN